ncbi:NADH-quinone oxidoreductase subunit D [Myroides odoratimimus]|uniref:NADH-quinone oxidoreductase subunit D n=1 Tax=Myroides odoratimimus TaxID=76832 RepID=UPI001CE1366B|nr:NADH-quinone oxidoreductase subunit D [Myroides odoratimimus]MCA4804910.1 NADH-quinone oxidoreductase subunit D [Myroides odoratimimus]MDM1064703.1 NADH-quinone oxidoreductase subunit D [Myroides odoratimimus]MDM1400745.1 NADH-quinone oxidoreductase subunit D [Myroides odoratimimus]MDM1410153.1 NADH-quinone oxidoreductase subunit D [Myroides odoratimimus]MDM1443515.1 NADH-quinone oxidoreductase subunit D [Myroides odoratimimus]
MSDLLLPPEQRYAKLIEEKFQEDGTELQILNLGPTHPATHGIFQNIILLDGEKVLDGEGTVGYIHRAFEKIAENRPFYQINVLTDRLNYCSSPINNTAWWLTVEKTLGIEIPKRVQYLRVIVMELARIADHIICSSVMGVDTGALTGFLYVFQYREKIYEIFEEISGARLTTNMGRIGGFEREWSPKVFQLIEEFLREFPAIWSEFEGLLTRNRIFMDRTIGVGGISAEEAINFGFTGPNLRAAGVDYDVRIASPYCSYEDFDFDIPVGTSGDCYDRFCVRNAEVWESLKIIRQALDKMPEGPYHADVPDYYLPPKEDVYTNMEALIYHFKIIMGEVPVPVTELYNPVEGGNGELGFYLITDGSRTPYRLHFRRPCFIIYQAYNDIVRGGMLSDAIITLSSLNIIAGELDA